MFTPRRARHVALAGRGRHLAMVLLLACTACHWDQWAVARSADPVGTEWARSGLAICPNGIEYRDHDGYGSGISDVEISQAGFQLLVRYRLHTFSGPNTKIREWIEFELP
jgi:hypothetical protein